MQELSFYGVMGVFGAAFLGVQALFTIGPSYRKRKERAAAKAAVTPQPYRLVIGNPPQ